MDNRRLRPTRLGGAMVAVVAGFDIYTLLLFDLVQVVMRLRPIRTLSPNALRNLS